MKRSGIHAHGGFSLIELVMVIVISGVIAGMLSVFISRPISGYTDLSRRAGLVYNAESALRRMQRDIREALPNSVRVKAEGNGSGQVLELIHVRAAARYREGPEPGNTAQECLLNFAVADNSFSVPGGMGAAPVAGDRLVISNWNNSGPLANAYTGGNITPAATTLTLAAGLPCAEPRLTLSAAMLFPQRSPRQRFYIVDTPVSYVCDTNTRTLTRYSGYTITASHSSVDTNTKLTALTAPSGRARVAEHIESCAFRYSAGATQRGGLASLDLQLMDTRANSERVRLLHQVHVSNVP